MPHGIAVIPQTLLYDNSQIVVDLFSPTSPYSKTFQILFDVVNLSDPSAPASPSLSSLSSCDSSPPVSPSLTLPHDSHFNNSIHRASKYIAFPSDENSVLHRLSPSLLDSLISAISRPQVPINNPSSYLLITVFNVQGNKSSISNPNFLLPLNPPPLLYPLTSSSFSSKPLQLVPVAFPTIYNDHFNSPYALLQPHAIHLPPLKVPLIPSTVRLQMTSTLPGTFPFPCVSPYHAEWITCPDSSISILACATIHSGHPLPLPISLPVSQNLPLATTDSSLVEIDFILSTAPDQLLTFQLPPPLESIQIDKRKSISIKFSPPQPYLLLSSRISIPTPLPSSLFMSAAIPQWVPLDPLPSTDASKDKGDSEPAIVLCRVSAVNFRLPHLTLRPLGFYVGVFQIAAVSLRTPLHFNTFLKIKPLHHQEAAANHLEITCPLMESDCAAYHLFPRSFSGYFPVVSLQPSPHDCSFNSLEPLMLPVPLDVRLIQLSTGNHTDQEVLASAIVLPDFARNFSISQSKQQELLHWVELVNSTTTDTVISILVRCIVFPRKQPKNVHVGDNLNACLDGFTHVDEQLLPTAPRPVLRVVESKITGVSSVDFYPRLSSTLIPQNHPSGLQIIMASSLQQNSECERIESEIEHLNSNMRNEIDALPISLFESKNSMLLQSNPTEKETEVTHLTLVRITKRILLPVDPIFDAQMTDSSGRLQSLTPFIPWLSQNKNIDNSNNDDTEFITKSSILNNNHHTNYNLTFRRRLSSSSTLDSSKHVIALKSTLHDYNPSLLASPPVNPAEPFFFASRGANARLARMLLSEPTEDDKSHPSLPRNRRSVPSQIEGSVFIQISNCMSPMVSVEILPVHSFGQVAAATNLYSILFQSLTERDQITGPPSTIKNKETPIATDQKNSSSVEVTCKLNYPFQLLPGGRSSCTLNLLSIHTYCNNLSPPPKFSLGPYMSLTVYFPSSFSSHRDALLRTHPLAVSQPPPTYLPFILDNPAPIRIAYRLSVLNVVPHHVNLIGKSVAPDIEHLIKSLSTMHGEIKPSIDSENPMQDSENSTSDAFCVSVSEGNQHAIYSDTHYNCYGACPLFNWRFIGEVLVQRKSTYSSFNANSLSSKLLVNLHACAAPLFSTQARDLIPFQLVQSETPLNAHANPANHIVAETWIDLTRLMPSSPTTHFSKKFSGHLPLLEPGQCFRSSGSKSQSHEKIGFVGLMKVHLVIMDCETAAANPAGRGRESPNVGPHLPLPEYGRGWTDLSGAYGNRFSRWFKNLTSKSKSWLKWAIGVGLGLILLFILLKVLLD